VSDVQILTPAYIIQMSLAKHSWKSFTNFYHFIKYNTTNIKNFDKKYNTTKVNAMFETWQSQLFAQCFVKKKKNFSHFINLFSP